MTLTPYYVAKLIFCTSIHPYYFSLQNSSFLRLIQLELHMECGFLTLAGSIPEATNVSNDDDLF